MKSSHRGVNGPIQDRVPQISPRVSRSAAFAGLRSEEILRLERADMTATRDSSNWARTNKDRGAADGAAYKILPLARDCTAQRLPRSGRTAKIASFKSMRDAA